MIHRPSARLARYERTYLTSTALTPYEKSAIA